MNRLRILFPGLGVGVLVIAAHIWRPPGAPADLTGICADRSAIFPARAIASSPSVDSRLTAGCTLSKAARDVGTARLTADWNAKFQEWRSGTSGDAAAEERVTRELLAMLSDGNTGAIVRSLTPEDLRTRFATAAVERWLTFAPAEAARWLAERPDATEHHAWLVANRLRDNPDVLRAYCDELSPNAWKEQVLQQASLAQADTSPEAAITFAEELLTDARIDVFETIAYAWFSRDAVAALRWVQAVSEPVLRERLLAVGAKAIARVDADLALDWLVEGVRNDALARDTALTILETPAE